MVVVLRALEQVEFDETRNPADMDVALEPARLEGCLLALADLEAIHRDEHELPLFSGKAGRLRLESVVWGDRKGPAG